MANNLKEAIKNRRSNYNISNFTPISDEKIKELIELVVTHVPSAFNSQSTRIVLLTGESHKKFWQLVKDSLKKIVPAETFSATETKIDTNFASGYGTVLFYEDTEVIKKLQETFTLYADRFPVWSDHTSGMHQFALWTLLEDEGFGASLQHYNPIIDEVIAREWNIKPTWKLIAQMPFGIPVNDPGKKEFSPLEERILIFS